MYYGNVRKVGSQEQTAYTQFHYLSLLSLTFLYALLMTFSFELYVGQPPIESLWILDSSLSVIICRYPSTVSSRRHLKQSSQKWVMITQFGRYSCGWLEIITIRKGESKSTKYIPLTYFLSTSETRKSP